MSKFVPLDDLADKSAEQRQDYYMAACDFLQVPPELNLLKYFYTGDAPNRKLILYATRGATDLIRERMQISTVSLTQHDGPGYVSFTVTGKDPGGRLEMATGVTSTEGLKGDSLAVAITIAQTKAARRMTLQFAGGGFLDETELPTGITPVDPLPPGVSLAQLFTPAPSVSPNSAPGADVTNETQEEFSARMAKLRADAAAQLMNPSANEVPSAIQTAPVEAPKKRTRRSRNNVSLDSPGQEPVQTVIPSGNIDAAGVITPVPVPVQANPVVPVQADPAPVAPQPIKVDAPTPQPITVDIPTDAPSAEQLKEYRTRLAKYANDILPNGGMIPTEGIGGVTMKLRKFAGLQLGESKDVMKFSTDQWTELLDFLDSYTESNGAAKLVAYIDKVVGVK